MPNRALIAVLLMLALMGCERNDAPEQRATPPPRPVEVTAVQRRPMAEVLPLVGSVTANESLEIRPEITGQIAALHFSDGERVARGQLLLRLDDRELRAELAEASARLALAEQEWQRMGKLFAEQFVSQAEVDRSRAEQQRAAAEVERLRARLAKTEVRAPFAGTAGVRRVAPGALVTNETVITRLDDLSRVKIEFTVPEAYLRQVQIGTVVRIVEPEGQGQGNTQGTVYFVSPHLDRQSRAAQVRALVEQPPETLRPGMFADLELLLREPQVLAVPEGAVLARGGNTFLVTVLEGEQGKVAGLLPVRLGLRARGWVEVQAVEGELQAGQQVVAAGVGVLPLFPGAPLEPRPMKERN
jgi:membrane fusion protein, multidrug efflux system